MYSKLTIVNAQTGAPGDSDLCDEVKLLYGNVKAVSPGSRARFEARYGGERGQRLGLLFPDEEVRVDWRETPWTPEELLS